MNVIPGSNKALIQYPKEMRKPAKEIIVGTNGKVIQKRWEQETRVFLYKTLRSWVLQRNKAHLVTKNHTSHIAYAVDRLLLMLVKNENSRLHVLCAKVLEYEKDWVLLLPSVESSCHMYTQKVIAPIFLWCDEYVQVYSQSKF